MAKDRAGRRGLGSRISDVIEPFFPSLALSRDSAMVRRSVLQREASHYQGAGRTARGKDFRVNTSDAVEAMRADRARLSWIGRDMLRNNPRVVRIRRQLVGNVVGAGIQLSVRWLGENKEDPRRRTVERLIKQHCLRTSFDADGMKTMLGQHGQAFGTIVGDGEVLLRRRFRRPSDGYALNFQVQALEADFLNTDIDGPLPNGNYAVMGIEFNPVGRRVAYHLFKDHPGGRYGAMPATTRVDARNVIHAFDPVRPGQQRGVTWLAPVITLLHELQKYQDGQVKRQEIAALFAAIVKSDELADEMASQFENGLQSGAIFAVKGDEEVDFTDPPSVDGYGDFMGVTDRVIAAAMGLTYEGLTGDYSHVSYTSGRMGRMDVDPQIKDWQQNLMIAQVCDREGDWIKEAIEDVTDISGEFYELVWTAPVRPVVDPTKDYPAMRTKVRSGFASRQGAIRELGGDPDGVFKEWQDDAATADGAALVFDSDPRRVSNAGVTQARAQGSGFVDEPFNEEDDNDAE